MKKIYINENYYIDPKNCSIKLDTSKSGERESELENNDIFTNHYKWIKKKKKQSNCKNCGAPATSYKCEYCGTILC